MTQVALVTGAASGFGYEISRELRARGFVVYATDLRLEPLERLENFGAKVAQLDVTSDAQVQKVVADILAAEGRIDVLIANAGYGNFGSIEETSPEAVRNMFEVNFFGVERCVRAVLPAMREQHSGRILITTSIVAHVSLVGLGWYAATKHAARAMANALRQEVRWLGIKVSLIEPGTTKTGFGAVAFGALDSANSIAEYRPVMQGFEKWLGWLYRNSPGPKYTVRAMLRASTAKRPKAVYPSSIDVRALKLVFYGLHRSVVDGFVLWLAKRK
jgi:NADP-dependent 3-hydroxy acid dehydrogenase YdfG